MLSCKSAASACFQRKNDNLLNTWAVEVLDRDLPFPGFSSRVKGQLWGESGRESAVVHSAAATAQVVPPGATARARRCAHALRNRKSLSHHENMALSTAGSGPYLLLLI